MENPSSPKETISQFERLLAGLARAEVDCAVVGGVAVILNGYHRQTRDTDLLVDPNVTALEEILRREAAGESSPTI